MSLASDIGRLLAQGGLVTLSPAAGFNYYDKFIPDTPDEVTAFFNYEGPPSEKNHSKLPVVHPRFQLRTRGSPNSDDTAESRMAAIHLLLNAVSNVTLESGRWCMQINDVGYWGFLSRDDLGRAEFVGSFELIGNPS